MSDERRETSNKFMPETQETFELLKNYIEEAPIGLLLFHPQKKALSWNKYVLNILHINEEEIKKNKFGLLTNQIYEILENQGVNEKELIGFTKPLVVKKIIAQDKNIVLVISETHQENIGEMSHELRRPLTNIKTLTESLLLGARNEPETAQKFLEQINFEVDRLTRLITELLSISKIKAQKVFESKKKIKLKPKVEDAIKLLHTLAEKNKTTIKNEVSAEYELFADSEQIEHVIQNLIENAIRYSEEGSQVIIKPGPVPGSFQVDDTGIGIQESEIPKIFDRFYRVNRTKIKGSSGLGLSIVKNVVDMHGGRIEVKSKVGSGSSFIIFLPFD